MFERKTVFIVGAGASHELNLPMGDGLMRMVAEKVNITHRNGFEQDQGDKIIAGSIIRECQENRTNPNDYFEAGRTIAAGMMQAISIDNFLHSHATNSCLTQIGKMAIARCILEAERASLLWGEDNVPNLYGASQSWLVPAFQMMHEGVSRENAEDTFKNISMIVFNYDRCIEHYMRGAMMVHFRLDDTEVDRIMPGLKIVHPYGQVGLLRGSTTFGAKMYEQSLPRVSANIRTFTEQAREDDLSSAVVKQMMATAEVVVFLGFSYNEMNLDYLEVERDSLPLVFGTSLGISQPNVGVIEDDLEAMFPLRLPRDTIEAMTDPFRPSLSSMTCRSFLESYKRPILRGS